MSRLASRIRRQFSDARPAKRAGLILLLLAAFSVVGTPAWAYWTTTGHGSGSATTGTLNPPTNVHAGNTLVSTTVHVSWEAPTSGAAPTGYYVTPSGGEATSSTCGTVSSPDSATNCDYIGITTAGTFRYTVTAVFHSWTATSGSSDPVTISTVGPASQLAFTTSPSTPTASQVPFTTQPVVTIRDAGGNTVTTDTSSVTLTLTTPAGATLACTTNPKAAVAGIATFAGCQIDKVGTSYTLTAASAGLAGSTSSPFNITLGAATKLGFTTQPGNGTGGTALTAQPVVTVQDAGGNTVTTSSAPVTVAIGTNPSSGTLAGTLTVNASNGVATFAGLSINKIGNGYTLTAASTGLAGATSSPFNITLGAATKLGFTTQPGTSTGGTALTVQPVVTVQDAGGNTVTTSSAPVTLAIGTNPGSGTLAGTLTVNASSGVAAFTGLSINNIGNGYTLTAASTGLAGSTSISFNITLGAATRLAWVLDTAPTSCTSGGNTFSLTYTACGGSAGVFKSKVALTDAGGNAVSNSGSALVITVSKTAGTFTPSNPTTTVTIPTGSSVSSSGGDGTVAGRITFTTENGNWPSGTNTITATPGAGDYTIATASFVK